MATRISRHPDASDAAVQIAPTILDALKSVDEGDRLVREWNWFLGLGAMRSGDKGAAIDYFAKVPEKSVNGLRARYQLAIAKQGSGQTAEAVTLLKSILDSKPAPARDLEDLAKLALARIYYGQKKYQASAAVYRTVSRNGGYFGTALFEQAWAFFMAGYPNQALGALHGAESPFFEHTFNPEATMLRSMILYWMCLYPSSENALREFIARHSGEIQSLEMFLARQQLQPRTAWELFENLIAGVSSESLGISRTLLMTAAGSDAMKPARNGLAVAMTEFARIENNKVSLGKAVKAKSTALLRPYIANLEDRTGSAFIRSLGAMRESYVTLRDQADFLYVELLTSEKDKLLGKEHLGQNKFATDVLSTKRPAGWGKSLIAWRGDNKREYWWDEVGFYISTARPECTK
jgi:tetratricopeptide (TPR) repeat protein